VPTDTTTTDTAAPPRRSSALTVAEYLDVVRRIAALDAKVTAYLRAEAAR
jgi:hypothetical protein